jgi:hypothetical protein
MSSSGGSEAHGGRVCQHAEAIDVSLLADFWRCRRPPVAAVIIEAPSMFQARMTAVVRRLAPGVPFGEVGLKLSAEMIMATRPESAG